MGIVLATLTAQDNSSSVLLSPKAFVPIGTEGNNYQMGTGLDGEVMFSPGSMDFLSIGLDVGYIFAPLALDQPYYSTDTNMSLISSGLSLKGTLPLSDQFSLWSNRGFGGNIALLHGSESDSAMGYNWKAGMGFSLQFSNRTNFQGGKK